MAVQQPAHNRVNCIEVASDADVGVGAPVPLAGAGYPASVFGFSGVADPYRNYNEGDILISKVTGGITRIYQIAKDAAGTPGTKVAIQVYSSAGTSGPPDIVYVVADPLKYVLPALSSYVYPTIEFAVVDATLVSGASIVVLDGTYAAPTSSLTSINITGLGANPNSVVIDVTANSVTIAAAASVSLKNLTVLDVGAGGNTPVLGPGLLYAENCIFSPTGVVDGINVNEVRLTNCGITSGNPGNAIIAPAATNVLDRVTATSPIQIGGGDINDSGLYAIVSSGALTMRNTDYLISLSSTAGVRMDSCRQTNPVGSTNVDTIEASNCRFATNVTTANAVAPSFLNDCVLASALTTAGPTSMQNTSVAGATTLALGGGSTRYCTFEGLVQFNDGLGNIQRFQACDMLARFEMTDNSSIVYMSRCRVMSSGGANAVFGFGTLYLDAAMPSNGGVDQTINVIQRDGRGLLANDGSARPITHYDINGGAPVIGLAPGQSFVVASDYTSGTAAFTFQLPPAEQCWDGYQVVISGCTNIASLDVAPSGSNNLNGAATTVSLGAGVTRSFFCQREPPSPTPVGWQPGWYGSL